MENDPYNHIWEEYPHRMTGSDADPMDFYTHLKKLVLDFLGAGHITRSTNGIGASAGNDIAFSSFSLKFLRNRIHGGHHVTL